MPDDNILPFRRRRSGDRRRLPRPSRALWRRIWDASLDRLSHYAEKLSEETDMHDLKRDLKIVAPAGQPVITMTRSFNAPRALVWKAMSEPEHVVRWWGPHDHVNKALEFDFRVGGKWRIESTMSGGEVINFFGEFREIEAPRLLTQTFAFDGLPDGMFSLDTVELEEVDGRTLYRARSLMPDVASRDGMLESGMETGVVEGFERLDVLLEEFKAKG